MIAVDILRKHLPRETGHRYEAFLSCARNPLHLFQARMRNRITVSDEEIEFREGVTHVGGLGRPGAHVTPLPPSSIVRVRCLTLPAAPRFLVGGEGTGPVPQGAAASESGKKPFPPLAQSPRGRQGGICFRLRTKVTLTHFPFAPRMLTGGARGHGVHPEMTRGSQPDPRPKVCHGTPRFYYYFHITLVHRWSLERNDVILFLAFSFSFTKQSNSRSLKMSSPRKRSLPMCDVNIVLEHLVITKDSPDGSGLCAHFCSIRSRDNFCLNITPRTVFIFYFSHRTLVRFASASESMFMEDQINADRELHCFS